MPRAVESQSTTKECDIILSWWLSGSFNDITGKYTASVRSPAGKDRGY